MVGIQEVVALAIVALVAGRMLWRRRVRPDREAKPAGKSGACSDCTAAGPPPKESTVRFYRRQNAEGPASGAFDDET